MESFNTNFGGVRNILCMGVEKLIFMGTPEFALPIMEAINHSSHKIAAVYTQAPKKSKIIKKLLRFI